MGDAATGSAALVDGRVALPGEFPATIGLAERNSDDQLNIFCSATLIAPETAVTAAHCLAEKEPESLALIATNAAGVTSTIAVESMRFHPRADPESADFDLAVLNLVEPIADIPPAFLTSSRVRVLSTDPITVIGFGATSSSGAGLGVKTFGQSRVQSIVGDRVLLGGGGAAPCFGDSGGAVMLIGTAGESLLAVISRAADPARPCTSGAFAARANMGWAEPPPNTQIKKNPNFGGCSINSGASGVELGALLVVVAIFSRWRRLFRRK